MLQRMGSMDSFSRGGEPTSQDRSGLKPKKRLNLVQMNNSIQVSKHLNESLTPGSQYSQTLPQPEFNIFDTKSFPLDRESIEDRFRKKGNNTTNTLPSYDIWENDRTEAEWWAWCTANPPPHASAPFYTEGAYAYRPVEVVDFNPSNLRFTIRDLATGFTKQIIRLSLKFLPEKDEDYLQRVELCKMRQKAADIERRFMAYVESVPAEQVPAMGEDFKKRIMQRASKKPLGELKPG
jgi:hypothetical protein